MNIDRLTEIAVWLEAGAPESHGVTEFNMAGFIEVPTTGCGTACCIAGAAIQFSRETPFSSMHEYITSGYYGNAGSGDTARDLLELDWQTGEDLFYPHEAGEALVNDGVAKDGEAWAHIDAAWAARCIRKLIATGEVDWVGTRYA